MKFFKSYGVLFIGPILLLLVYCSHNSFTSPQKIFLVVFGVTVFLWLYSNVPLYITGLLSVSTSIIMGLAPADHLFSNFSHPIIFLFLGGFLLAEAFSRVSLDKRISLYLLNRPFINGSINKLLLALMILTSTFTMWISNTATTAMMLPLVLGVLSGLQIKDKKITSLILICIAYSASIGGVATPIGSTPNMIGIGMLQELSDIKITFFEWIVFALPITVVFMAILYLLATLQLKKYKFKMDTEYLATEYKNLSQFTKQEKIVLIVFFLTVILWLLPSLFKLINYTPSFNLNTGAIAIFGASLLFIVPLGSKDKILPPQMIKSIDWSSLLLFGAGLALGKLLFDLQLADMAGKVLQSTVSGLPLFIVFLIIFGFVIFSTELTSNTASANIILPIMISLAMEMKINPLYMAMGVSISCSLAFMLPVATPPNAIVYGSEKVDKKDMIFLGFGLNIIFTIVLAIFITLYNYLF